MKVNMHTHSINFCFSACTLLAAATAANAANAQQHAPTGKLALNAAVEARGITWIRQPIDADLFAAHGDESDCRLYDQVSNGDCVPARPLLCLPAQALRDFLKIFKASLPVMPAALVQARGPPSVR